MAGPPARGAGELRAKSHGWQEGEAGAPGQERQGGRGCGAEDAGLGEEAESHVCLLRTEIRHL